MTRREFRIIFGQGGGPSVDDITRRKPTRRHFKTIHRGGVLPCAVGFWGSYTQVNWASGIDFPATWTKLLSRNKDNLSKCDVLVCGRYSFATPYAAHPTTSAEFTAVSNWINGGGVLFVLHDYYGAPSSIPSTPVTELNTFLAGISAQVRAVVTASPEPNTTDFPVGTFNTSVSHPLLDGVNKLWTSAPGRMSLGTATLLFEARRPPSFPYAKILSVESYGAGSIVFCADDSMVNNSAAASAISGSGNKINVFLENLCNH